MSMIERVARAIHQTKSSTPWEDLYSIERDFACRQARAAIEAVREPTEAMVAACAGALQAHIDAIPIEIRNRYRNFKHGLKVKPAMKARARYTAMIDAALAEDRT